MNNRSESNHPCRRIRLETSLEAKLTNRSELWSPWLNSKCGLTRTLTSFSLEKIDSFQGLGRPRCRLIRQPIRIKVALRANSNNKDNSRARCYMVNRISLVQDLQIQDAPANLIKLLANFNNNGTTMEFK